MVATDGVQPDSSKQATKATISAGVGAMAFLPSVTSLMGVHQLAVGVRLVSEPLLGEYSPSLAL